MVVLLCFALLCLLCFALLLLDLACFGLLWLALARFGLLFACFACRAQQSNLWLEMTLMVFFVFTFVAVCVWCVDFVFLHVVASSSAVGL